MREGWNHRIFRLVIYIEVSDGQDKQTGIKAIDISIISATVP